MKFERKKITYSFIAVLVLLFTVRIILKFAKPDVNDFPSFTSYEEAIYKRLPEKIRKKAKYYNSKGRIVPLNNIEGKTKELSYLLEDLNLAISSYEGWKLHASDEIIKDMQERLNTTIKKWGKILSPDILRRIVEKQTEAIKETRYFSTGYCQVIEHVPDKIDNYRIIVTVHEDISGEAIFNVSETFVSPMRLKLTRELYEKEKQKHVNIERAEEVNEKIILIVFALLVFLFIAMGIRKVFQYLNKNKIRKKILRDITKRNDLVENGHFVTALEIADKYLEYFPDSLDIKVFKERLLALTNDDPEKAQKAFMEEKKIRLKLNSFQDEAGEGILGSVEEQHILEKLVPYYPELKNTMDKAINKKLKVQEDKMLHEKIAEVERYINNSDYCRAESLLQFIDKEYRGNSKLIELKIKMQEIRENINELISQAKIKIEKEEFEKAENILEKVLDIYEDNEEAAGLLKDIERLKNENNG